MKILRHYVSVTGAPCRLGAARAINGDDIGIRRSYTTGMGEEGAHVRFRLETKQPIALSDFVSAFVGVGSQFEKFVAREYPDLKADSEFFVEEVRKGSIEADLIAWVTGTGAAAMLVAPQAIEIIDKAQILSKFVGDLRERLCASRLR